MLERMLMILLEILQRIKMKSYNLTLQEKINYCVPSCVQAILRAERILITQEDIYNQLEKGKKGVFVSGKIIEEFFRKRGFDYKSYRYNEVTLNEPEIVLWEMNEKRKHGIVSINSHAHLFIDFNEPILKLLDPEDGQIVIKNSYELHSEMYKEKKGSFGLVKRIS